MSTTPNSTLMDIFDNACAMTEASIIVFDENSLKQAVKQFMSRVNTSLSHRLGLDEYNRPPVRFCIDDRLSLALSYENIVKEAGNGPSSGYTKGPDLNTVKSLQDVAEWMNATIIRKGLQNTIEPSFSEPANT